MPADETLLGVVRGWVAKADAELENASVVLGTGPDGPMNTVAFHAQQCAEKYRKALLCFRGDGVSRIHDVELLLARAELWGRIEMTVEESRLLTDYATVTRYPGDCEPVSHAEASDAVELARRVRRVVRESLPEEVTRCG